MTFWPSLRPVEFALYLKFNGTQINFVPVAACSVRTSEKSLMDVTFEAEDTEIADSKGNLKVP